MKIAHKFFTVCCWILLTAGNFTYAADADFDTTYNIEYRVDDTLTVSVKEVVAIINQSGDAVPSSFIETIKNISIYDVKVLDAKGREITPQTEIGNGQKETVITTLLKDPAVGKGKKTELTILYKTKDLTGKTGRILNLHIPKAPVSDFMQEYNVTVLIPKDFGPQISLTPRPLQEKMEEEGYTLFYNKQTLENYGISATFGDYQLFDFNLSFQLINSSFFTKNMEITIPPPLKDYQEINIESITPKPTRLTKDPDGNILATINVGGKKNLTAVVKGKAKVYTKKIGVGNQDGAGTNLTNLNKYVQPQKYWEASNGELKELVKDNNALWIYTYITKNIAYDFDKAGEGGVVQRKGALQTFKDKKGLCLDFTDLFIAMARAAGIPAREISGYAYAKDTAATPLVSDSVNGGSLHSWAQFYHPQLGWVSVDPTWGTTSGLDYFSRLDNNHLAFVIHGLDSQRPQPAPQIKVEFANDDFFNTNSIYDLKNLPQSGSLTTGLFAVVGFVVGLGLCTIFVLARVRLKVHCK